MNLFDWLKLSEEQQRADAQQLNPYEDWGLFKEVEVAFARKYGLSHGLRRIFCGVCGTVGPINAIEVAASRKRLPQYFLGFPVLRTSASASPGPRLVYSQDQRSRLELDLRLVEVDAVNWRTLYIHNETGELWLGQSLDPEYHGGGHPYLVRLPEPNIQELEQIAATSAWEDERFIATQLLQRVGNEH